MGAHSSAAEHSAYIRTVLGSNPSAPTTSLAMRATRCKAPRYTKSEVSRGALAKWDIIIMFYVYILQSKKDKSRYIGITSDLKNRIEEHNSGKARYSNLKRPYNLIWYCAFLNKIKAYHFEKYLKSSSGYAFTNKRFL